MNKRFALTKSTIRMIMHEYGTLVRSEMYKYDDQRERMSLIEAEVLLKVARKMVTDGMSTEGIALMDDFFHDKIPFGTLLRLLLLDSSESAGESEV